jgi:hypothetical protein
MLEVVAAFKLNIIFPFDVFATVTVKLAATEEE